MGFRKRKREKKWNDENFFLYIYHTVSVTGYKMKGRTDMIHLKEVKLKSV